MSRALPNFARAELQLPGYGERPFAWSLASAVFRGSGSDLQQPRIAWVLHRRNGRERAKVRLPTDPTAARRPRLPERFDAALPTRWSNAIAHAIEREGG